MTDKKNGIAGRMAGGLGAAESDAGALAGSGSAPRAPRVRDELTTLEYPRHVHKAGGEYLRVENETEARAAVADGWCVDANEAAKAAPEAAKPAAPK
jgi:hypothetical protein